MIQRIRKNQARKLYNEGKTIIIAPCNLNIYNPVYNSILSQTIVKIADNREFDNIINDFEWYNCNHEMGYYCSYYIGELPRQFV